MIAHASKVQSIFQRQALKKPKFRGMLYECFLVLANINKECMISRTCVKHRWSSSFFNCRGKQRVNLSHFWRPSSSQSCWLMIGSRSKWPILAHHALCNVLLFFWDSCWAWCSYLPRTRKKLIQKADMPTFRHEAAWQSKRQVVENCGVLLKGVAISALPV